MRISVVDACVAVKWFLKEEHTEEAGRLLDGSHELHVPDFLVIEVHNVLCKRIRRGEITPSEAGDARARLRRLPLRYHEFSDLLDSAYSIANETKRSLYDCLYLALAVSLDERMVTADGPFGKHVLWVEDV